MHLSDIEATAARILSTLPRGIKLVAAAKTRSAAEAEAALRGGIQILGYNYLQEAERLKKEITLDAAWHLIGHLQRNKAKKAVELFDMIETIDSVRLADAVNRYSAAAGKIMPILIEVNSGREANKNGVFPEHLESLITQIALFSNIEIQGLMTMGIYHPDQEKMRPFFRETKKMFDAIAEKKIPGVKMRYLSMGMSDSYPAAIEEGATIVRIGSKIFGSRY